MINAKESITGVVQTKQTLTGVLNKAIEYVEPVTQEKTVTPTKEVQEVTPDENYTGLSKVIVNVYEPIVGEKKITKNGTYKAIDENLDGYSEVEVEVGDTKLKNAGYLFYYGTRLNQINELINMIAIDCKSFNSMFYYCPSITTLEDELSNLKMEDATNFQEMFYQCYGLVTLPILNATNIISVAKMFFNCIALENLGGFKNLGQAYSTTNSTNYSSYKLDLSYSKKLTHDSLMNVINNLYDIATRGCKTQQLVLGSTNLAKLTAEEVAIATNKGWSVS